MSTSASATATGCKAYHSTRYPADLYTTHMTNQSSWREKNITVHAP